MKSSRQLSGRFGSLADGAVVNVMNDVGLQRWPPETFVDQLCGSGDAGMTRAGRRVYLFGEHG